MRIAIFAAAYVIVATFTAAWTYDRECMTVYKHLGEQRYAGCAFMTGYGWPLYWAFTVSREFTRPSSRGE